MPFNFKRLAITDVILIEPMVFNDERGYFMEIFKSADFIGAGITKPFVQINQSKSTKNVLRGMHFQKPPMAQAKLVRAISGAILDVAVDIRKNSPTYGKWVCAKLDSDTKNMMYVPEGFAHGFAVLSEIAEIEYCCTNIYSPSHEGGVVFNDPYIGIKWGISNPLVSPRDKALPVLSQISPIF